MSFTATETEALLEPGLKVDPTKEAPSMEAVNAPAPGDAGDGEQSEHLKAAIEEYGKEATMAAYNHGWRPKGEHKGNPDNFVTPIGFLTRYADTADKRAKREADAEAERRVAGIAEATKKQLEAMGKRIDKVDEADREATKRHFAQLIKDDPENAEKHLEDRDKALKEIDDAAVQPATEVNDGPDPATIKFFEEHPNLRSPQTADDKADQAWAAARAAELENRYPDASLAKVLHQVSHDLTQRKASKATDANDVRRGRTLSDDNSLGLSSDPGGVGDKVTISTMSADQRNAFAQLADMGVYTDDNDGKQKYVDGINAANAEAQG